MRTALGGFASSAEGMGDLIKSVDRRAAQDGVTIDWQTLEVTPAYDSWALRDGYTVRVEGVLNDMLILESAGEGLEDE